MKYKKIAESAARTLMEQDGMQIKSFDEIPSSFTGPRPSPQEEMDNDYRRMWDEHQNWPSKKDVTNGRWRHVGYAPWEDDEDARKWDLLDDPDFHTAWKDSDFNEDNDDVIKQDIDTMWKDRQGRYNPKDYEPDDNEVADYATQDFAEHNPYGVANPPEGVRDAMLTAARHPWIKNKPDWPVYREPKDELEHDEKIDFRDRIGQELNTHDRTGAYVANYMDDISDPEVYTRRARRKIASAKKWKDADEWLKRKKGQE